MNKETLLIEQIRSSLAQLLPGGWRVSVAEPTCARFPGGRPWRQTSSWMS